MVDETTLVGAVLAVRLADIGMTTLARLDKDGGEKA